MGDGQFEFNFEERPMTDQELILWNYLQGHRGRQAAVQADRLAEMFGMDDRKLRMTIKHLVEDHAILIGSSTVAPYGYYVPETAEEVDAVVGQLYHRLASIAVRIARIKRISVEEIFGQLRIAGVK